MFVLGGFIGRFFFGKGLKANTRLNPFSSVDILVQSKLFNIIGADDRHNSSIPTIISQPSSLYIFDSLAMISFIDFGMLLPSCLTQTS